MRKTLIALIAVGSMAFLPAIASAGGRFGTDRGSRYEGRHYSSRSSVGFSFGFGSRGYSDCGYSYSNVRFGSYRPYYRSAPVYCPPPVVYVPAPPVVYTAPPVVYYSAPAYAPPAYAPSTYYYTSGSYYYGR